MRNTLAAYSLILGLSAGYVYNLMTEPMPEPHPLRTYVQVEAPYFANVGTRDPWVESEPYGSIVFDHITAETLDLSTVRVSEITNPSIYDAFRDAFR